jgi:translocation and assembly module TamA
MRSILQLAAARAVELQVRALVAVVALLLSSLVLAQAGLKYRVEIEAPKDLAEVLRKGLNVVRWENDPQMTPEQLRRLADDAAREARETAATEGYFSARVEVHIDEATQPWSVRLVVDPGERTQVGEIDLRFNGPAMNDPRSAAIFKRVRDTWPLRRGQPFRQADWDAAKRRAVRELSAWRYAGARVADSRALVDPETRRATLMVELASGPPFRFGEIRVSGVRRYSEQLVENLSPFRPGDDYDRDTLLVYQRRLLESGYFVSVQADIEPEDAKPDAALVRVAVIEAAKHHVEAGLSYSTDAGPRVELRYTNQDVLSSAWRSRSALRLDDKIRTLQFDFDAPPRQRGRWNSFFARARETDIQNELTRELAVGAAHNWGAELNPSALLTSAHWEQQRVTGDVTGDVTEDRHAVYFGYRQSLRKTDDFVSPREGYLGSFEVGGAPSALASRMFVRGVISASFFLPVGRRDDLLLRGQAGRVVASSREGIPSTFLFRTGGDQTVRGYGFESLGVKQGEAIVGGRRMVVVSTEYTRWVGDAWGIAGFVDAGNAWDDTTLFKAALGYGVGARFRTPIGPIRADLAYGQQTHQVRLHFSVGFTF